jgi:ribosomal protein S18 acetylase RimI-like enzyme
MIHVRLARDCEFDEIAALTIGAYSSLPGLVLSPSYASELRDVPARAKVADVLVAVDGSSLLGSVTYIPSFDCPLAEFDDQHAAGARMLAVYPGFQGRGAGRALMRSCIERATAANRSRLVLHTTKSMAVARQLYEGMGFRRVPDLDFEPSPSVSLLGYCFDIKAA